MVAKPVVAKPVTTENKSTETKKPVEAAPKQEKKVKAKKIDEEIVPENVSTKQALKNVLSELEDDGDNLIDSFIGSAKGKEPEEVASSITAAPSFINKEVE